MSLYTSLYLYILIYIYIYIYIGGWGERVRQHLPRTGKSFRFVRACVRARGVSYVCSNWKCEGPPRYLLSFVTAGLSFISEDWVYLVSQGSTPIEFIAKREFKKTSSIILINITSAKADREVEGRGEGTLFASYVWGLSFESCLREPSLWTIFENTMWELICKLYVTIRLITLFGTSVESSFREWSLSL